MKIKLKDRVLDYIIVSFCATIIICLASQIWKLDLNVLSATSDDKMLGAMLLKSIKEYGLKGIWVNSSLGAPDVSSLIDTPFIDYPMWFIEWIMVNILPSTNMVFYLFYILTYPMAATAMLFLLNKFSEKRFLNIVMSILFSLVPYHFLRGSLHSSLSSYFIVPIGLYFALVVFVEKFHNGVPESIKDNKWKKIIFWAVVCFVGLSNVYYAFFSMLIILVAVVYKMIFSRSWKPVFQEARVFFVMSFAFLLGIMPKLLYNVVYGGNNLAGIRHASETEMFSLKIIQLLLPPSYSRVGVLRSITEKYNKYGFNINENAYACLGLIGGIGFIILCIWVIVRLVLGNELVNTTDRLLNILACFVLVIVLFCVPGGFGTIFSYVITPELRCLNRASILITAICFLAVVLVCNKFGEKIKKKNFNLMICTLFIITIFLDVPSISVKEQQISKNEDQAFREFFAEVQDKTAKDSMIYQLPMTKFPESAPVYKMRDYSLFLGYVYTDGLKWSYGGEKGRNEAAMELYVDRGMSTRFVEQIIEEGFQGVYIDTFGFEDGGREINYFYQNLLELDPIICEGKRLYYYSLKDLDIKKIEKASLGENKRIISKEMGDLYFSFSGIELSDIMLERVAEKCDGEIDYEVIFECLFDNSDSYQISDQRYVREIFSELLKREASDSEVKNWCTNLENGLTRKEVFVEVCTSEEFQNQ